MLPAADQEITALRAACVRVLGARPGCAFPPAAGWLVTCAHVVGRDRAPGSRVAVEPWQGNPRETVLRQLDGDLDLALLEDPLGPALPLRLRAPPALGADLIGIGFPVRDGRPELDQFAAAYEGETRYRSAAGTERGLLKFQCGQVEYGFSGGPLVAEGTLCGVIRLSRDVRADLGGWAIPVGDLSAFCAAAGVRLPPLDRPGPAGADLPVRLRDLLLALPGWNERRRRRNFVTLALWGQPMLQQIDLDGSGAEVAADLVRVGLEEGRAGPLIALLAAIPREFGTQPRRDGEIAALLGLLRRWASDRE